MAAPFAAPWVAPNITTDQLIGVLADRVGQYAANNGVVMGGQPFSQKWQAVMGSTRPIAPGAAMTDDQKDTIVKLVLLLRQLGVYNAVLMNIAQYPGADRATGAGGAAVPAPAGGLAGNAVGNPLPADTVTAIVNNAIKCWNEGGAASCDDFIDGINNYLSTKLMHHRGIENNNQFKANLENAYINLFNLTAAGRGLGAPVPTIPVPDDVAGVLAAAPNPPFPADPFVGPFDQQFGGLVRRRRTTKKRKTARKVRKVVRKVKKSTRKH